MGGFNTDQPRDAMVDWNQQRAPYPEALASLVNSLIYKEGWSFSLDEDYDRDQGCVGLTLNIRVNCLDSCMPRSIRVEHRMPVPPAAYNVSTWRRWLFEQILLVERHEAMEFFEVEGRRPFLPHHRDGNDPYTIFEPGTEEQELLHRR